MEETKKPWYSKIVWATVAGGVIAILSGIGLIPEDMQEQVLQATLLIIGTLVPIFRIWFSPKRVSLSD